MTEGAEAIQDAGANRFSAERSRVFLVGFMGAGKTTVGERLAALLGWEFVDLDGEIERRAGASVAEIFARSGETGFRRLESAALRRAAAGERVVIATGGGALLAAENRRLIRSRGVSVWLDPDLDTMVGRLAAGKSGIRPLLADAESVRELYRRRLGEYRAADLRLPVAGTESADEVAERIRHQLLEYRCAT